MNTKERFEEPGGVLCWNPRSVVADTDDNRLIALNRRDLDRPAVGKGILEGIFQKVPQDSSNLVRVDVQFNLLRSGNEMHPRTPTVETGCHLAKNRCEILK